MVQPNPPRFLREGDSLEYTVKVTNMTEAAATGEVELRFFDPRNEKSLDAALANTATKKAFEIPAKQSRSFSWPISVPDGAETVGFKAVAATREFSDGEEGMVPVLSRSLMVRESIPLWISGAGKKDIQVRKAGRFGRLDDPAQPQSDRSDGQQSRLVCDSGAALSDGISLRVFRAGLQPSVCQRLGEKNSRLRSEDPPHFRFMERNPGPPIQPGKERRFEKHSSPGIPLGRRGQERKPGQAQHRPALRREHHDRRASGGLRPSFPRCSVPTAPGRGSPADRPTTI